MAKLLKLSLRTYFKTPATSEKHHFLRLSQRRLVKYALTIFWLILTVFFLMVEIQIGSPPLQAASGDFDLELIQVASGFTQPLYLTHAGDASGRLFVVERRGVIKIIKNGTVLATPFLDINTIVDSNSHEERGLLGLAFHPNYQSNGYFYVNYISDVSGQSGDTVIARYQVSAGDPDVANPASATPLLVIDQPAGNHNGGHLAFGPTDDYLYISVGDGGNFGDPNNLGQDTNTLLGKILRIDVDGGTPYAIPTGNPYAQGGGKAEIWALGLRNAWRFSFDRQTGDLYLGDVGEGDLEEIDYQAAGTPGGVNFGWSCKEGTLDFRLNRAPCDSPSYVASLTPPIAEYGRNLGFSITGGYVYRGSRYPAMQGHYFYADFGSGRIWNIYQTGSNPTTWSTPEQELNTSHSISSFGEDEGGELYLTSYGNGRIYQLADTRGPVSIPNLSASTKKGSAAQLTPSESVTYTIHLSNSGDLSSETLRLTDTLPFGLDYVSGSLQATMGQVNDSQPPVLRWQGVLSPTRQATITYRARATGQATGNITNRAQVSGASVAQFELDRTVFVTENPATTTQRDFFLPGTQPGHLNEEIPTPISCDVCHTDPIYNAWRGSMMSQAGRDPLMWAALTVANNDAPESGDLCQRCHLPKGWLEGRSHPADGSALTADDYAAGIACEVCHRMVDPVPSTSPSDEAKTIDAAVRAALTSTVPISHVASAMLIIDPDDNRRGPFALNPPPPHTAYKTDFLGQSTNYVTESRLCGSCHNVDNPVLSWDGVRGQFWPNANDAPAPSFDKGMLFPIERTYEEWLNSQYAQSGVLAPEFAGDRPDGMVGSCQDCHMTRSTGLAATNLGGGQPVHRDCQTTGCLPTHDLAGGNTWVPLLLQDTRWRLAATEDATQLNEGIIRTQALLRKAATLSATLEISGTDKIARIRVTNQTGHKLPTGYPEGRRMWLNLKAYNSQDQLLKEWGAYDSNSAVLTLDTKVYEAKQGLTPEWATELGLPAGESFHFVLNNTTIKDNRIPPRGYTQAAFDVPGLRPVGASYADGQHWDETIFVVPAATDQIYATLYYQTSSKEYIDFLRTNGGSDGNILGKLWDESKSPPEVVKTVSYPTNTLKADFEAIPITGTAPLQVHFNNLSLGDVVSSLWTFGDGQTGTQFSPTHVYTMPGVYTVSLRINTSTGGNTTTTRFGYVTVLAPVAPQANFDFSPIQGLAPLTVVFTNTSTGDFSDSLWDFGDGASSSLDNPSHTYTAGGNFTVTLTVSGKGGSNSVPKVVSVDQLDNLYLPLILK